MFAVQLLRQIVLSAVFAGLIRDGEELIDAAHEAITDRETWNKVFALREAKARTHKRGDQAPESICSGKDF